jgi:hypothetical protein
MLKHLLTIEDAFNITRRGVVVVPGPLVTEYNGPRRFPVTLKFPGGGEKAALLTLEHMLLSPPPKEHRWCCLLSDVAISEVPAGTQIWAEQD